jgi:hypothetical protein
VGAGSAAAASFHAAGMIMFASGICVRQGAASQAAFEIIRQIWVISVQLFESLNVATQAVAAGFLGKHDRTSACEVLQRAFTLACVIGVAIGVVLFAARQPLVALFTRDTTVAVLAGAIMPVIAVFMPLDAGASIMDGGLIAAGQTNTLSVIQVAGSLVQYAALAVLMANGMESVVTVWVVLKVLTLARLAGGFWLHFRSKQSAYLPMNSGSTADDSAAAVNSSSSSSSVADTSSSSVADTSSSSVADTSSSSIALDGSSSSSAGSSSSSSVRQLMDSVPVVSGIPHSGVGVVVAPPPLPLPLISSNIISDDDDDDDARQLVQRSSSSSSNSSNSNSSNIQQLL